MRQTLRSPHRCEAYLPAAHGLCSRTYKGYTRLLFSLKLTVVEKDNLARDSGMCKNIRADYWEPNKLPIPIPAIVDYKIVNLFSFLAMIKSYKYIGTYVNTIIYINYVCKFTQTLK